MVQINFAKREINCKLVYYGPGLSGKTTNLEVVHKKAPASKKGELTSIATEGDRTLFFDYMPLELGKVGGMNTKFQLYTVPGQVYYNATRKLVLQGADGVVFVADSQPDKMDENIESFQNLEENLREQGLQPETIPMVLQWNKRDLPNVEDVGVLDQKLNKYSSPTFEAVAVTGEGVFPTLKKLAQMVLEKLNKEYGLNPDKKGGAGGGAATAKKPDPKPERKPDPPPVERKPERRPEPPPVVERKPEPPPERRRPERREREPEREPEELPRSNRKPQGYDMGGRKPAPPEKKGGKGVMILLLLILAVAGAFVGGGYTGKLQDLVPQAQKFYDDKLAPTLGGGSQANNNGGGGDDQGGGDDSGQ